MYLFENYMEDEIEMLPESDVIRQNYWKQVLNLVR